MNKVCLDFWIHFFFLLGIEAACDVQSKIFFTFIESSEREFQHGSPQEIKRQVHGQTLERSKETRNAKMHCEEFNSGGESIRMALMLIF